MNQLTEQTELFELAVLGRHVVLVEVSPTTKPKQATLEADNPSKNIKLADKFESMAELMQVQIDDKLSHDRQTNTPKRMGQAMSARVDGERLARTQAAMRALAKLHRAGSCPVPLCKLTSKKAVHDLMGAELERVSNGYHDYMIDTGKPREDASKGSLALWAMLEGKSEEQEHADKLAQMVRDLQFCKIPGYFQTPKTLIDRMLCCAEIEPGMQVLEPSAGAGAIADAIRDSSPNIGKLETIEVNSSLGDILAAKGHSLIRGDFLEITTQPFDRIMMNPPFEKLADIDHVRHAYDCLIDGGRLVAIMSPGPFFRSDKKCTAFQAWISNQCAEVADLPAGTFKESSTGVAAKLVVIDKE